MDHETKCNNHCGKNLEELIFPIILENKYDHDIILNINKKNIIINKGIIIKSQNQCSPYDPNMCHLGGLLFSYSRIY